MSIAFQEPNTKKSVAFKMNGMKRRELDETERQEAERLRIAWEQYKTRYTGATQAWLAAESGLGTQGAVSQYLRGVIPLNLASLIAICRVIEADPAAISPRLASSLQGLKPVRVVDVDDWGTVPIRMAKLKLSAGVTGFALEMPDDETDVITVPKKWIEKNMYMPAQLLAVQVKGESMEPSLYAGDIVLINTADRKPKDGAVFAVNYEGEAIIKRISRDGGRWWLTSDNPDQRRYHRKVCEGDACIIVGRVVKKESERI